ncbi:hypothetical protein CEUSTIGMA_g600.t1 [Chlamydomonas eustigma]|uniref:Uncharacterized protein n=1 Tax=Chlamydomonas eustigma TaxID=1157962 RepID=A0A250WQN4_9CHLO|nr:hypothetical protein CEUSTIGMA_g600.t1 [Chlamydomonas eustigma]|eukprot:GAX73147.1 hypothetical protein CEUSTIGMA_g600.t1 [Chlamydomonas eustigma]
MLNCITASVERIKIKGDILNCTAQGHSKILHQVQVQQGRRDMLTTMISTISAVLVIPSKPAAAASIELPIPSKATSREEDLSSAFVIPALSETQYIDKIRAARPNAMRQLSELIERGRYKDAAESLVLYPFDDVAQSAFYLPWAILKNDEIRATEVKLSYDKFSKALRGFEKKCREAASYRTEDDEVEDAFLSLNSSLDELLKTAMYK